MKTGPIDFLVLEDDPKVARLLVRALRPFGRTEHASSCDEARRLILQTPPIGLVVDWAMADGCGADVAEWAVRELKITNVLILSGDVNHERLQKAHRFGARYLLKPAPLEEIERFALNALSTQPGRLVLRAVQAWRQRYGLDAKGTTVLGLAVLGYTEADIAGHIEATSARGEVRRVLRRTGDATLSAAVARLHLEIRERR